MWLMVHGFYKESFGWEPVQHFGGDKTVRVLFLSLVSVGVVNNEGDVCGFF